MYEDFFGFNTLPFSITPDPRFFYDNPSSREAFAALRYGIEGRKGFIVITGEAGTGKTTLVKVFMQRAEVQIRTALIINPKLTATELLRCVLNDLSITPSTLDQGAMALLLKDYLFEQRKKGHVVALLVDEAQQLSNELLEELRLLSNLETNKDKLMQIVLVGQPELEEKLDQPELRQLKQRVVLRCRLAPLKEQEVFLYIQARLKTAGFEEKGLFDPKAVKKISQYSNGIPRLVNVICDNALLNCYALSEKKVSAEIIEEVACDLQLTARPAIGQPHAPADCETQEEQHIAKSTARSSVSQRPLAEFQDFFIAGEQRRTRIHWQRSLAGLATGFVFGVLAAAGLGAIIYSQSKRNDIADIAARMGDETDRRESVKNAATGPAAQRQEPTQELKDVEASAPVKPPVSTPPPSDSGAAANATPILQASKTGTPQAADSPERAQERQTVKNAKEEPEIIKPAAKRASGNRVGVARASANDRLEFEIYKAIANRAITSVEVSVIDGTAVLGGRVATERQKFAAAQAARSVPGVKDVRDRILVNDGVGSRYGRSRQPSFGG